MARSCSIFFFEGYVGVAPTILNLAKALDRTGTAVTIYATRNPFPTPQSAGEKTRTLYLRRPANIPLARYALGVLRRVGLKSLVPTIEFPVYAAQCTARIVINRFRGVPAGSSVGVDTNGSIVAMIKRLLTGGRYVYLSLELRNPAQDRFFWAFINALERAAYRRADAVIIQDEDRFRTLTSYLGFEHPTVHYLPNSPGSAASTSNAMQGNFLRERLGISESEFPVIVLQAGMIDAAAYSEEAARAFSSLDGGLALVFHERLRRRESDPYLRRVRKANRVNLFLSLDPIPMDELDQVYASATIGLAFYQEIDPNFEQISMASGKLGYYLKHGKPILVSKGPSLAKFVQRTGVGLVVKDPGDPHEVGTAIDALLGDYDAFSTRSRRCFEEEFDFDRKVAPVVELLNGMERVR